MTVASIDLALSDEQRALRAGVLEICKRYPGEYWRELDAKRQFPEKFVAELTQAVYLAALIPHAYKGPELDIRNNALILDPTQHHGWIDVPRPHPMDITGT